MSAPNIYQFRPESSDRHRTTLEKYNRIANYETSSIGVFRRQKFYVTKFNCILTWFLLYYQQTSKRNNALKTDDYV